MQEEFFPRVRQVLGQTPCVAFLVPAFIWAGLPAKGYDEPRDCFARAVHMGWFTEEAPARAWLARQQSHRASGRPPAPSRVRPHS